MNKKLKKRLFFSTLSPAAYLRVFFKTTGYFYKEIANLFYPDTIRVGDLVIDTFNDCLGIVLKKDRNVCTVQFAEEQYGTFSIWDLKKFKQDN